MLNMFDRPGVERPLLLNEMLLAVVSSSFHPVSPTDVVARAAQLLETAWAEYTRSELTAGVDHLLALGDVRQDRQGRLRCGSPTLSQAAAWAARAGSLAETIALIDPAGDEEN